MQIKLATPQTDLAPIAEVLQQLRPQFAANDIIARIKLQFEEGYQVAYLVNENNTSEVLAVAGFVIGRKLAWGKHIYVDDLVTNEYARSQGAGQQLIQWLIQYGKDNDCKQLHLDSGVQRFMAHKFYLREGFIIASHHFSTIL